MNNLHYFLAEEARCRRHAEADETYRELWLSMAERWSYLAQNEAEFHFEAAFHFRESAPLKMVTATHAAG
jgi:hypothetical protein